MSIKQRSKVLLKIRFLIFYTIPREKIASFPGTIGSVMPKAGACGGFGTMRKFPSNRLVKGFFTFFMTRLTCVREKCKLSAILCFHSRDNRSISNALFDQPSFRDFRETCPVDGRQPLADHPLRRLRIRRILTTCSTGNYSGILSRQAFPKSIVFSTTILQTPRLRDRQARSPVF